MSEFDRFTVTQLTHMHEDGYHRANDLFTRAEDLMNRMCNTAHGTAEYAAVKDRYRIAFAAAVEQHQLVLEIGRALTARRETTGA